MPRINPDERLALARLRPLLEHQEGVMTRTQALATGLTLDVLRGRVETGEWQRLHRGVLLASGQPPSLGARMWAAHLATNCRGVIGGAAVGHAWSLLDGDLPARDPMLVLLPDAQHLVPAGVVTRRIPDPRALAHAARTPPMLTLEHAVIDLVRIARSEADAVEVVLRACRLRLTTPDRIRAAMSAHRRIRRRQLLESLCEEVRAGVQSPLEREYRRRVAIPHGLPVGRAQLRAATSGGVVYRDLLIEPFGVLIELDGRLGHEQESDIWRDQNRDNDATLTGLATLRYGWLGVTREACEAAGQVAHLLTVRRWQGQPRTCGPSCRLRRRLRAA